MKMKILAAIALLAMPVAALAEDAAGKLPAKDQYITSEGCKGCHIKEHTGWLRTFHSTAIQNPKYVPSAVKGDFTQPGLGFTLQEVDLTIGSHWTQRYMKKIDDDYYILPKSWSISSQRWENYNVWSWQKQPYSKYCIGCHVVRFDPADKSYVEHTIGCEACHGPGKGHADTGGNGRIVNPAKLGSVEMESICASCHVRGKDPSGQYSFPIGFTPGKNLADYYIPDKLKPGEGISDGIIRIFREWWGKAGDEEAMCSV